MPRPRSGRHREDGMEVSLAGRTAVITGGSKGIGLCDRDAVRGLGRRRRHHRARARGARRGGQDASARAARGRVVAIAGRRRASPPTSSAPTTRPWRRLGKIDIVVNNAGTSRTGAFEKITDEIWQRRLRPEAVRRHPADAAGLAADEGAALGPDHQHAQYRRQGAARAQRADLDHARRRHGA